MMNRRPPEFKLLDLPGVGRSAISMPHRRSEAAPQALELKDSYLKPGLCPLVPHLPAYSSAYTRYLALSNTGVRSFSRFLGPTTMYRMPRAAYFGRSRGLKRF